MTFAPSIFIVEKTRRATLGSQANDPTVAPCPQRPPHRWRLFARLADRRTPQSPLAGSTPAARAVQGVDRDEAAFAAGGGKDS